MFIEGFKKFMIDYNVIGVMVGFAFASATITFIRSFVSDLLLPVIYLGISQGILKNTHRYLYTKLSDLFEANMSVSNFIKEFITWGLILISTYFIIKYFVKGFILGEDVPIIKHSITPPPLPTPKYMQENDNSLQQEQFQQPQSKYYNEKFYL